MPFWKYIYTNFRLFQPIRLQHSLEKMDQRLIPAGANFRSE